MAKRYGINQISEIQNRDIFVDANVLIYWHWANAGNEQKETDYSRIYQALISQSSKLFVDFSVISEVINRKIKTEYNAKRTIERRNNPNFNLSYKHYRNSEEGHQKLNGIYTVIKDHIEDINIVGKSFSENDIISFLHIDTLDFNDKGILKICQENNFVLLTDDGDYKDSNVDILTCNTYILH